MEKGFIVFEGASQLNGDPIVGIVTMKSTNRKTGNMAQLWILRSDMQPVEASQNKKDDAICGNCKLRQSMGGACYVNIGQAPLQIYRSYKRGIYRKLSIEDFDIFKGTKMRFGAYGDGAALPLDIMVTLKSMVDNNTSYTHQWETNKEFADFSMASVDNVTEKERAKELGFRTFRVVNDESEIDTDEILCPNYTVGIQCIDCKLCSGNKVKAKNIAIVKHGSWKGRF
jgi:hypothetical protein